MKDPRQVLLEPVVSEKAYDLFEQDVYVFRVHPSATKGEIRNAVQIIFDVTVTNVNTLNRKGKKRINRRTNITGKRPDTKRAIVKLAPGDSIPIFDQ